MILNIVIYVVLVVILIMLIGLSYQLPGLLKLNTEEKDKPDHLSDEVSNVNAEEKKSKLLLFEGWIYVLMILVIIGILTHSYFIIKGSLWEGHLMEWLNIVLRLMHFTFGIAWIGASFYFVFLENALNRTKDVRDELAGNLWAIHGGGFYYLEKYKIAPKTIPKELHWFKYEAYFTWLSGFCLLFVVYYFNAKA
ncbi:MAG: urate hydroxylase PuuD, partial [Flavisolibacter sp.]